MIEAHFKPDSRKRLAQYDADWLRLGAVPKFEGGGPQQPPDDDLESWILAAYSDFPELVGDHMASLQANTRGERLGDDMWLPELPESDELELFRNPELFRSPVEECAYGYAAVEKPPTDAAHSVQVSPPAPVEMLSTGRLESAATIREQDRLLPIANVARIIANGLPSTSKVSLDCKHLVQEIAGDFIGFITSEANYQCLLARRTTITPHDIISAIIAMGERSRKRY